MHRVIVGSCSTLLLYVLEQRKPQTTRDSKIKTENSRAIRVKKLFTPPEEAASVSDGFLGFEAFARSRTWLAASAAAPSALLERVLAEDIRRTTFLLNFVVQSVTQLFVVRLV